MRARIPSLARALLATALLTAAALPLTAQATQVAYNLGITYVPAGSGGAGQVQTVTYPSGKVLTYQYDATGQLTGMRWNGQALITHLTWSPLGMPKAWTWPFTAGAGGTGLSASRSYNTAGQLTQTEIASFTWDAAGRVSQITQNLLAPSGTAPNVSSQPLTVTTAVGYDAAGRVKTVVHTPTALTLPGTWKVQAIIGPLNASYSYDANGNRSQAAYSNFGGAGGLNSLTRNFTLDASHNKVLAVTDTSQTTSGSQTSTRTLSWDASGKLLSDGENTFTRDPAGRIASVINPNSGTTTYQTNLLAQRVRKQYGSGTSAQAIDTVYGESDIMGGLESYPVGHYSQPASPSLPNAEYLYLPTALGPMPIAVQIGTQLYAIHTDHLNTPRRLTDSNGQPVWQWAITGFGELEPTTAQTGWIRERLGTAGQISNTSAVSFNLRYPGQQFDSETGLFYNHHRTYDPYLTVGYTEADPLGLAAGWNRFGYVGGNALGGIDSMGLTIEDVNYVFNQVKQTFGDLKPSGRVTLGDIEEGNSGETSKFTGIIYVSSAYEPKRCLSKNEWTNLFYTLLHESMHSSDPLWRRLITRNTLDDMHHRGIYNRESYERLRPKGPLPNPLWGRPRPEPVNDAKLYEEYVTNSPDCRCP